jgi:hypothetical protein
MKSRHEAALDTPKAPKSKSRANAASGDLRVNVFCSDVVDATHFISGMQCVDSVRPFTALTIDLPGGAADVPKANGSAGRWLCRQYASLRFVCGRQS